MQCSGGNVVPRSSLGKRYQCSRRGPRYIRIVCRKPISTNSCDPILNSREKEVDKNNMVNHNVNVAGSSTNKVQRISNVKRSITLQSTIQSIKMEAERKRKAAAAENILKIKEARAKEIEESLIRRKELTDRLLQKSTEVEKLGEIVKKSRKKLKQSKTLTTYYKEKGCATKDKNGKKARTVTTCLESSLRDLYPNKHASSKAKLLMYEIRSGRLLNGEPLKVMQDFAQNYVRELFKPWRMLKTGDMSAIGAFKTSTIKALRDVIDHEKIGLFPSASSVDRARAKLDHHAAEVIGYERRETVYGEVFFLNFDKALRHLLKATQLHDIALGDGVKVSLSIDGADLFKDRTHVSAGIKITDTRGVHPVTKQPLFVMDEDSGEERIVKIQSSEMCCILVIADARDKKELYEDVFKEFYDWGERLRTIGLPASNGNPALRPFVVTHTTDLKASWHLSNRGGGCKNKTFFCTLCPCTKNSLISYKVDGNRCARCQRRNKRKCYHHDVCDSLSVPLLLQRLEESIGTYHQRHRKAFEAVSSRSKLRTDHMQLNKENDIMHISYVIPQDDEEKLREYTQFISNECRLRSIPMNGRLEDLRSALRECVQLENAVRALEKVKQWYASGRETVPLVEVIELLIPCIIHCENRVGEKIITILLRRQLDAFNGPKMEFIDKMDATFQTKVLGSVTSPAHWRLKHSKDSDGQVTLEPLQVRNQTARKIIASFDIIVEDAVPESDRDFKAKVISAITSYREAMKLLTLHRNLNEDEVEEFQDHIDDFYELWIDLFGEEGITNYIHILGSGHMLYFLKKYNCLYMYSQQGWEDLNNRCQAFLLHNTSRGGFGSGEGRGKSYTYPIVRFILRDLLWKTGDADLFFSSQQDN